MTDDQIWNHTNAFFEGIISREEFWRRARFSYPTHQICLNTYEALKSIKFIESYEV